MFMDCNSTRVSAKLLQNTCYVMLMHGGSKGNRLHSNGGDDSGRLQLKTLCRSLLAVDIFSVCKPWVLLWPRTLLAGKTRVLFSLKACRPFLH